MHQRRFNDTGFRAGEVGLGTWQLGGDWGEVSEDEGLAILRAAVEAGTNFFDTADVYGAGRSESVIGKFLRETRAEVFVATKLGRWSDPGWPGNFTPDAMARHTDASLKRLGVETIDLTQLHCIPTEELRRGEVFETLRELKRAGKIRHFGASVESMEEALICLEQEGLASLQIIFNLYRQKPIAALFERAKAKNVALIVRLPLASGLLAGKFTKETKFAPQDHRNYNADGQAFNVGETFAGIPFETGVELADGLKPLAPEGMTLAETALRWCLDYDAVSVLIPGGKTPEQARRNAAVSGLPPLPEELHRKLADYYSERVTQHIRGPY
jgi:aryl-alcohol dehydrogenase-like predicted oxidoreductase